MDKLSYEIFSILESKFLFDPIPSAGRVRVLSIDAGGSTDGLLAAASLARLEASLRLRSGDSSARIADFFDLAAGSGVGGLLVALLFTRGDQGLPLLSASEALHFLVKHHRLITRGTTGSGKGGFLRGVFGGGRNGKGSSSSFSRLLREVFGDLTLRDTVKPVLIPCYDLSIGAPFVFSRADAVETAGYDFRMREACAATMGMAAGRMSSVDGRTVVAAVAVDGGVATGNPAAAAITHVLNNKMEFPMAAGVDDLLLVSLGNGEAGGAVRLPGYATPTAAGIVRIAGEGVSDMIDQAVAMAFGQSGSNNYVRIQGREVNNPSRNKPSSSSGDPTALLRSAEEMLLQRNVESMLFRGKKLSEKTNGEKLEWASGELIKEQERRKKCPLPIVVFRKGSPRNSSSSSSSASSSVSSP